MAEDEVGSLGRELTELFRTMSAAAAAEDDRAEQTSGEPHAAGVRCPHGWCPVCSVVEVVQDNPELLGHVLDAATTFARAVRDVMETVSRPAGDETGETR